MNLRLKIHTICENTVPYPGRGLLGEHGLSMLVEVRGRKILFDCGGGLTISNNAATLGVNFDELDAVVLSHGHHDHTGGLKNVLQQRTTKKVLPLYAHPDALKKKYRFNKSRGPRENGIPWTRKELERMGARMFLETGPVELGAGLILTGEIPRLLDYEKPVQGSPARMIQTEQGLIPDMLNDDQALAVETAAGVVVVLGCAHAGLINTLQYILKLTGTKNIYALVGGTHLVEASPERIKITVEALNELGLKIVAPCHCTGALANCLLFRAMEDRFLFHHAGSSFEF